MKSGNIEDERGGLETGNQLALVGGNFALFFISIVLTCQCHHHMKTGTNAMRFHDVIDWITAVATALTAIAATFVPFQVKKLLCRNDLVGTPEEDGV